jgi:hypothetical protein
MRIGRHTQVQNLRFAVHISPRREPAQAAGCNLTPKGFRIQTVVNVPLQRYAGTPAAQEKT